MIAYTWFIASLTWPWRARGGHKAPYVSDTVRYSKPLRRPMMHLPCGCVAFSFYLYSDVTLQPKHFCHRRTCEGLSLVQGSRMPRRGASPRSMRAGLAWPSCRRMRLKELALADSPWLLRRTDGVLRQPLPAASALYTCVISMRAREPQLADTGLQHSSICSAAPSHSWLVRDMPSATLHMCRAVACAAVPAPRLPWPTAVCDRLQHT